MLEAIYLSGVIYWKIKKNKNKKDNKNIFSIKAWTFSQNDITWLDHKKR